MAVLHRWALMAVIVVSAAVPWYTLRLLPLLTVRGASVSGLDVLVAVAVGLALAPIVRDLLQKRRESLVVWAFLVYMLLPLAIGVQSGQTFFAVREFRALAFYALALAFMAGNYTPRDYRRWAWGYVVGATVAMMAVFAHLRWVTPLPGYPSPILRPVDLTDLRVAYLDWTVPVVAMTLGLGNLMTVRTRFAAAVFAGVVCVIAWYVLATIERFMQLVTAAISAIVAVAFADRAGRLLRLAALGVFLLLGAVALHTAQVPWFENPLHHTAARWWHWHGDGSLSFRLREVEASMAALRGDFARSLFLGKGLGEVIYVSPYLGQPETAWPYSSLGYGFLLFHTGLIGLSLYLMMAGSALVAARRWGREDAQPADWPARTYGMIGLVALLMLNLLYPAVDIPEGAIAFSLFYGMVYCRTPRDPITTTALGRHPRRDTPGAL